MSISPQSNRARLVGRKKPRIEYRVVDEYQSVSIATLNLQPFHKSELHYDTLLELPNRIGISLIGYLSSKLAHLLLNLIAINGNDKPCRLDLAVLDDF